MPGASDDPQCSGYLGCSAGQTIAADAGTPSAVMVEGPPAGLSCGADGGASDGGAVFAFDGGAFNAAVPAFLGQSVVRAATPVPPLSGGTLLALSDGTTAVAADPDRDQLDVVDLGTNTLRTTVSLQAGDEPGRLVEDGSGLVHVALRRGGAIVSLDPRTGALGARRAVCSAPRGIVFELSTGLLHVACAGGELVSLPAAGGPTTRTLTLEHDLRDVVLGLDGQLIVSTFRGAQALVVRDGAVAARLHPGSGSPLASMFPVLPRNTSPAVAWRMVSSNDSTGNVVMLHQMDVDDPVATQPGGYSSPQGNSNCAAIVQTGVSVLTIDGEAPPAPSFLAGLSLAIDVAVSPDGSRIALAVAGNDSGAGQESIVEAGLRTFNGDAVAGPSCSFAPTPSATPIPAGQVVAVTYTKSGVLLAQTREPAQLWRGDTGVSLVLATDSRADTGHRIFHMNAGSGLACASCHPEGGEDGRVWSFSCLGLRRTQSIRGDISATAPFHWDGAEKDFSHLMTDVFVGRMSGPPLTGAQTQAVEDWVDTIKPLPPTAGLDAAAVARGGALFNDTKVACASCHAGSLLTNNATVDVGTGAAFQVPSLRGASWRAPYMHNGCAATLADRFDASCGGGDKHGATSQLTTSQVSDLVTYLESL